MHKEEMGYCSTAESNACAAQRKRMTKRTKTMKTAKGRMKTRMKMEKERTKTRMTMTRMLARMKIRRMRT